jgi:hypothetical protein
MRPIQSRRRSDLMVAGKPMSVVYSVGVGSVKPRIRAGNYVNACLYTSPTARRT